jgi:hypothetical protein
MKKLILASLIAASMSANAFTDEDWIVTSITDNPIVYTVLPNTVSFATTNDGVNETRVVVELYDKSTPMDITRGRLRVSGCKAGTGKVTIARMDSTLIKGAAIFDWDRNGERVYDMLALRGCVAGFEREKENQQKPVQPTKSSKSRSA